MNINRRRFLKSATATLALPWLEALSSRGSGPPVRAAWLYFPNGVAEGSWGATEGAHGRIQALTPQMAPLARHLDSLSLVRGAFMPRGNGHGAGTATWLTGGDWDARELNASGPSVDQIAAQAFAEDYVVPSLSVSAKGTGFFAADISRNNISWSSPGRPVFRESEPHAAFQSVFGAGVDADRSLLDDVKAQLAAVRKRVSANDRARLDAYTDAVRGIERRLAFVQNENTRERLERAREVGLPFGSDGPASSKPNNHGEYLDLLLDVVALALWSGASRAATVMLDHGQSNRYANFLPGVRGTWHALSHWREASGNTDDDDGVTSWDDPSSKRAMYDAVVTWHHERVAKFIDRLSSMPEADGSLLDQSMVIYGSNLADGNDHGEENLPVMLVGGAGGKHFGRRLLGREQGTNMSSLHLAVLQTMGVDARRFAGVEAALKLG